MSQDQHNPGSSDQPPLPDIDWSAIQIPPQTQPTTSTHNPAPPSTSQFPSIDWGTIHTPQESASFTPTSTQEIPNIDWSSIAIPTERLQRGGARPLPFFDIRNDQNQFPSFEEFMTMIALDPAFLQRIASHVPGLQQGLDSDNEEQRMTLLREVYQWIQMVNADARGDNPQGGGPDIMDPSIQERIEKQIQRENVQESRDLALEHAPEMFGRVEMLYIRCKVNSLPIVAFIDSGAQMSILSKKIAEECGVSRLLDDRFAGMARGVGTAPILGRVHLAQLEIDGNFLPCSFSVMEQTADLILGLDMLKRHQCTIDLERNRLIMRSAGIDTPFISESEIPDAERMFSQGTDVTQEQEDKQLAEAIEKSDTTDD